MYNKMLEPTEMPKDTQPNIFRKAVTIMNESCSLRGLTESVARRLMADGSQRLGEVNDAMGEMYSLEEYLNQTLVELECLRKALDIIVDSLAE